MSTVCLSIYYCLVVLPEGQPERRWGWGTVIEALAFVYAILRRVMTGPIPLFFDSARMRAASPSASRFSLVNGRYCKCP